MFGILDFSIELFTSSTIELLRSSLMDLLLFCVLHRAEAEKLMSFYRKNDRLVEVTQQEVSKIRTTNQIKG